MTKTEETLAALDRMAKEHIQMFSALVALDVLVPKRAKSGLNKTLRELVDLGLAGIESKKGEEEVKNKRKGRKVWRYEGGKAWHYHPGEGTYAANKVQNEFRCPCGESIDSGSLAAKKPK